MPIEDLLKELLTMETFLTGRFGFVSKHFEAFLLENPINISRHMKDPAASVDSIAKRVRETDYEFSISGILRGYPADRQAIYRSYLHIDVRDGHKVIQLDASYNLGKPERLPDPAYFDDFYKKIRELRNEVKAGFEGWKVRVTRD